MAALTWRATLRREFPGALRRDLRNSLAYRIGSDGVERSRVGNAKCIAPVFHCSWKERDFLGSGSGLLRPLDHHAFGTRKGTDVCGTPSPWNIANGITAGRILMAPVTGYCIVEGRYDLALGGLIYAGISDWLDGMLARRYNLQTVVGSFLDPAADKLLISTTMVCLAWQMILPKWLVALVVGRDLALVAGWAMLSRNRVIGNGNRMSSPVLQFDAVKPLFISKVNTGLQIALGFTGVVHAGDWGLVSEGVLQSVCAATAISTTASGMSYGHQFWHKLQV